jgi:hypothetical protein
MELFNVGGATFHDLLLWALLATPGIVITGLDLAGWWPQW